MKISYSWLKQYVNIDMDVDSLSEILTDTGLEVEGLEKFETIKGGLEGIVVGKVLTCEKHPNADKLSKTTVDVGMDEILPIVCGAPNVAAGQTVLVATVGTVLYNGNENFKIKKSKIRGEVSEGMICAEDELGLGTSHDGIMVLPNDVPTGTQAKDYFNIESDFVFEIGLTPNRVDAASHVGVARDIVAALYNKPNIVLQKPSVDDFIVDNNSKQVEVVVEDSELCPRYTGLTISGVEVKDSPDWMKNHLQAIGLQPINNIVDTTNYVLHELGQPLHAFDLNKVKGNKVVVKTMPEKTKFTTLDEEERELSDNDLMICDESDAMCIAGVFGGVDSGVSESTTSIFLESAYFNPVSVRKTAKRHTLNTDASFRFERGIDPNGTVYALKRAALLIKEVAGGEITSEIFDSHPEEFDSFEVTVSYDKINKLIGKTLDKQLIRKILTSLEIEITNEDEYELNLLVPPYRVDVERAEDVVEEILRIYGYNNVEIPRAVKSSIVYSDLVDGHKLKNAVSDMLVASGMYEIMCNSLTKSAYFEKYTDFTKESIVAMLNPLSADHDVLRKTLLFGVLESIVHNANRKNADLSFFEFGATYHMQDANIAIEKYSEKQHLAIAVTGAKTPQTWNAASADVDFFYLKAQVHNVLEKLGFTVADCKQEQFKDSTFQGLEYSNGKNSFVKFGLVSRSILKDFDIDNAVYYAEFDWDNILAAYENKISFKQLAKFPEVKRDLSLLIDESVKFETLKEIAYKTEKRLLQDVTIFDVYQGKGVPENKKSYAVSFILQDAENTLTDKKIDKVMRNIIGAYQKQIGAELR